MDILTLAPRTFLDRYDASQTVRVRLVRDSDWCYYSADLSTNSHRNFAHSHWVLLKRKRIDGYLKLRKEELEMAVSGQCDAKGCTREAYVRVRHVGTPFCDWQLIVCAKHEEAARDRAVEHSLNCSEGGGARTCHICEQVIDYGETYQRDVDDPTLWAHVKCLTDNGTDVTVTAARSNLKGKRDMKDPVTKQPLKKGKPVAENEDDLPEDLKELEAPNGRSKPEQVDFEDEDAETAEDEFEEAEDEEDAPEEAPAPKKVSARSIARTPATKPVKATRTPKSAAKKPAAAAKTAKAKGADPTSEKASTKYAEKASKVVAKGEKPTRASIERFPDGDKAVMRLKRGKGGEISIRLNSHVVTQWQASEKNKGVIAILGRARYWFTVKNSDEAESLTASANKIAGAKGTQKHLAAALNRAVENIDRWTKEINKF